MLTEQKIHEKLAKCIRSSTEIQAVAVSSEHVLFMVPTISAKEVIDVVREFNIHLSDISLNVYNPKSIGVFFDLPENKPVSLEAVLEAKYFVCTECDAAITDSEFRTTQLAYLTQDALYCHSCWESAPLDTLAKLVRVYRKGRIIDDIPRRIKMWSTERRNDDED